MKVSIDTIGLNNALGIAKKYTSKDSQYPGSVRIEGINGNIQITSTNGIETVRLKNLPFSADELGVENFDAFSIDAKKITAVVAAAKTNNVQIELNKDEIVVVSGRAKAKIALFADAEKFMENETQDSFFISKSLIDMLDRAKPTIDSNNPKFELNGALVEVSDGKLSVVSTDTRRLSVESMEVEEMKDMEIIIPKASVASIISLFETIDVTAAYSDSIIKIATETIEYSTKVINGCFPEWERIVPKEYKQSVVLNSSILKGLLDEAMVFEEDIIFDFNGNTIKVMDESLDTEVVEEAEGIDADFIVAINGRYIVDYLAVAKDETLSFNINDGNLPITLQSSTGYKHIVMPITSHMYVRKDDAVEDAA